jgi:hypothetical protein
MQGNQAQRAEQALSTIAAKAVSIYKSPTDLGESDPAALSVAHSVRRIEGALQKATLHNGPPCMQRASSMMLPGVHEDALSNTAKVSDGSGILGGIASNATPPMMLRASSMMLPMHSELAMVSGMVVRTDDGEESHAQASTAKYDMHAKLVAMTPDKLQQLLFVLPKEQLENALRAQEVDAASMSKGGA